MQSNVILLLLLLRFYTTLYVSVTNTTHSSA